mmetsp:Transcript_48332/g.134365  ORF Transcript_48332/g.134365 Transcript_48332/m.134365 type:complete len:243 (-) Transcript_48332:81-809(-)
MSPATRKSVAMPRAQRPAPCLWRTKKSAHLNSFLSRGKVSIPSRLRCTLSMKSLSTPELTASHGSSPGRAMTLRTAAKADRPSKSCAALEPPVVARSNQSSCNTHSVNADSSSSLGNKLPRRRVTTSRMRCTTGQPAPSQSSSSVLGAQGCVRLSPTRSTSASTSSDSEVTKSMSGKARSLPLSVSNHSNNGRPLVGPPGATASSSALAVATMATLAAVVATTRSTAPGGTAAAVTTNRPML